VAAPLAFGLVVIAAAGIGGKSSHFTLKQEPVAVGRQRPSRVNAPDDRKQTCRKGHHWQSPKAM